MPSISATLLESITSTGTPIEETGEKFKGDGWHGYADGNHTVAWQITDFIGTIHIQGSLVKDPNENDWADIMTIDVTTTTTDSTFANFVGNYVWVRAKVANFTDGILNNVQYNH